MGSTEMIILLLVILVVQVGYVVDKLTRACRLLEMVVDGPRGDR